VLDQFCYEAIEIAKLDKLFFVVLSIHVVFEANLKLLKMQVIVDGNCQPIYMFGAEPMQN
jgi:hypothetical protein